MSELKTLYDISAPVYPFDLSCYETFDDCVEAIREAAMEWLNVFKKNRDIYQDPEEGINKAFIKIFFNLEDETE